MKVEIWHDARYPDYGLTVHDEEHKFGGTVSEITEDEFAEYQRANAIYADMQKKLIAWSKRG